ncbi:MAG: hypothetical protein ACO3EZ_15500 [Prochlorotrichaceae cyanobacterium]
MLKNLTFVCTLLLGTSLMPVVAGEAESHFAKLALEPLAEDEINIVNGETGGSFSLMSLAQYDDQGNLCSGYSYDSLPNHILELSQPVEELSIWVDSNRQDTTLLIQGNNSLDCGDDLSAVNPDAGVSRENWAAGVYKIWVGSSVPGAQYSYQLEVQPSALPVK